ncbi:glycosyltransferase [Bradyrhizobium sp. ORS 111]|uniref:glycosyltransferase n=1 Tax=Bradyrhizobium sp. ORS 111 TaxID=1685958 RepID=UPI00388E87C8
MNIAELSFARAVNDQRSSGRAVVHVIAGLARNYGGPAYSVPRLCEALAACGVDLALLSVSASGERPCNPGSRGYRDLRFPQDHRGVPLLGAMRLSRGLAGALRQAIGTADIVHNHGLWLMPNVQAGRLAARANKPFVLSPRGMLAPAALAFSQIKKRVFWHVLQDWTVRRAACLHATSETEYAEIRAFGLGNPIAIIPNGIDVPEPVSMRPTAERVVLSLGRIHPKKGLNRLLAAWAKVEPMHPEWRLRIVGPSENGHDAELAALAALLDVRRVSIEGPLYDEAKQNAFSEADLFVMPSLNENFGLTVAEALAAGIPAIVSKGAPWRGLEVEGCGWWVEQGADALAEALAKAMAKPREALQTMGMRGRAWMVRDFSWERVARDMSEVYRWVSSVGERPSNVRVD